MKIVLPGQTVETSLRQSACFEVVAESFAVAEVSIGAKDKKKVVDSLIKCGRDKSIQ